MAGSTELYVHRVLAVLVADPARTALRWRDVAISAAGLRTMVLGAADALDRAGAGAARPVAILTEPNHPAMLAARYGAHLLGAPVVHIRSMNPRSDAETLSQAAQLEVLLRTGARALVVDEDNAERGARLAREVPGLIVLGTGQLDGDSTAGLAGYQADDLAVIDFTSGSTNRPKLVRQPFGTRETLIARLTGAMDPDRTTTLLSVTPISHTTAPMVDAVLAGGGTVVLHEDFDVDAVLDAVESGVSDVYLAVPHLYRLVEQRRTRTADLRSLRRVIYSGTPAAPARVAAAVAVFGDTLTQVYGTTEAGGISCLTAQDHREPELHGSVGRPFPWVRVELRDPGTGAEVARGKVGEVCVASDTLMAGYLCDADSDDDGLCGGWLRTGDLGHWDRYGYLRLVGRAGNVIKSGGLKIYPGAVERVLLNHPLVANAAVFSVRDADYVEHLHVAVELRTRRDCRSELRAHVATALSATHAPEVVTVWPSLPLTPSGKPDTVALRARRGTP